MGDNVFDVDEFLNNNSITIKLGGKEFLVSDIPYSFHEELKKDDVGSHKKALADLLGCDIKVLEKYGIAATNIIIEKINKSLFPKSSQKEV